MLLYTQSRKKELSIRWRKIQEKMKEENIEVSLISTNTNLLYTLGCIISGYVYLPQEGDPLVFVKRPVDLEGENVFYIRKVEQIAEVLVEKNISSPRVLLLEGDEISYSEWMRYEKVFFPRQIVNGTNLLRKVRSVKTDYEVAELTESAKLQSYAYKEIPLLYRPGMSDHEFTIEIERLFRLRGNLGIFRIFGSSMEAFMGTVLVGEMPPSLRLTILR